MGIVEIEVHVRIRVVIEFSVKLGWRRWKINEARWTPRWSCNANEAFGMTEGVGVFRPSVLLEA